MKNPSSAAVVIFTCLALLSPPFAGPARGGGQIEAAQDGGLRIVVLDGEDSVNIIAQGTAVPTLVEVRDRNDLPVSGALVLFLLGDGGTATLNAGLQQVSLTTNALGQAAVVVNPVATGAVELSVSATFAGETATAAIVQTNFATAAEAAAAGASATGGGGEAGGGAGGGLGTGAIAGLAGAGAAVGVGLAVAGGGDSTPPVVMEPPARVPSPPSPPSLTAGDRRLAVSWSTPAANGAAIDDYDVQYRPSAGGNWSELDGQFLDRRATIPGLTNGTTYEVRVRAGNSVGKGAWSASATGTPASVPGAPAAPTLTVGDGQLEVSWAAPADNGAPIVDYDVQYRAGGGTWRELSDNGRYTNTRATIPGLTNGTTYEVHVRAENSEGESGWSPSARGTPRAAAMAPDAPSAPTVTAGDGELEVSWRAPADNGAAIVDYDAQYRVAGGNWRELSDNGRYTNTRATIPGLTNGTTYEVHVRAENSEGESGWSASARGTPRAAAMAPDAPSAPTVEAGDGELLVSWAAPADNGAAIVDYDVQYRAAGGTWRELSDNGRYTNTRATIPGLTNGTTYEVHVRAENSEGESGWSPSARGTPRAAATAPHAPSAPTVEAGDGELLVSWAAPADNGAAIVDYDVQYRVAGGTWRELSDNGTYTNTRATIPGLTNGTTYEVHVRAENSEGESGWSPSARGTPRAAAMAPDAPSAPTVTAGDGELEVSWRAPADNGAAIVDYDVQYRAAGGTWRELSDNGTYTNTRATIPGLTNGTTYEVHVRAENSEGESGWSASARGTPRAAAMAPDAPSAPTVTAGDGELEVSWRAPADNGAAIVDYDVQYRAAGGTWRELSDNGTYTNTRATIPGLTNGTTYEVHVRAENSEGESGWSASARGTPRAAAMAPDAPSAPTVEAGDGELLVSWAAPADNGAAIVDYDVQYRAAGGTWRELSDNGTYTNTRATIPGLTNGTTYEVHVRAENSEGESGWSPSARGTPRAAATAPHAPSAPTVEAGDGELLVSWAAPADNGAAIEYYELRFRAEDEEWTTPDWPNEGKVTAVRMRGVTNGTTYEVQVRAWNSVGASDWSSSGWGTPMAAATAPDAPAAPTVEANDGELLVSWSHPADNGAPIEHYELRIRPEGEDWSTFDLSDEGTITGVSITGVTNGTTYEVKIRAVNSVGKSDWSPSGWGTPMTAAAVPDAPATPTVEARDDELLVSWSHPADNGAPIEHYELRIRPEGEDWSTLDLSNEGRITEVSITGVTNGTTYEVKIRAVNSVGKSDWSESGWGTPGAVGFAAKITGLARLSVADADAEENVDETIDFTVTLDRPASTTVSVDYATADGSAQAGVDYVAKSGTLTFSPGERSKTVQVAILDDTHDEGEETFTLALSNASGGIIVDGLATGRIENHDPLPRALLARFGRTAAVHVVEQVEERLQAPREPGVEGRFAGQELRPGMKRDSAVNLLGRTAGQVGPGNNGPMGGGGLLDMGGVGGRPAPEVGPMGGGGPGSGPMGGGLLDTGGGDLLNGSAFALNQETRQGGVVSFWSRGAQSSFMGREGALALDGDVRTTMFGADYAKGPVVVGLSLANSRGLGSYAGVDAGRVATSVTGLYPWLGYRVTDRVTVWGVTGYGTGGMMLTPGGGPTLESGLSMAMAAGGTRGELIGGGSGGFGLAFKADALWVGTSMDGVDGTSGRLAATETAVTQFRTGLEGSRELLLAGRISLRPSAEVGLRHDGGDAETGAGVDVGGGLIVADSSTGLALDVRMRMLVLHQAAGFRERGMALSLSYDPTPSTPLGFKARVAPSWGGEATGGAEALWGRETMAGLADSGLGSGHRLDTEIGYGLPVGSRFVGTPRVGFAATAYGRDYRMGYGLALLERQTLNLELSVDARRRESPMQNGADNGFLGRAVLGW